MSMYVCVCICAYLRVCVQSVCICTYYDAYIRVHICKQCYIYIYIFIILLVICK